MKWKTRSVWDDRKRSTSPVIFIYLFFYSLLKNIKGSIRFLSHLASCPDNPQRSQVHCSSSSLIHSVVLPPPQHARATAVEEKSWEERDEKVSHNEKPNVSCSYQLIQSYHQSRSFPFPDALKALPSHGEGGEREESPPDRHWGFLSLRPITRIQEMKKICSVLGHFSYFSHLLL